MAFRASRGIRRFPSAGSGIVFPGSGFRLISLAVGVWGGACAWVPLAAAVDCACLSGLAGSTRGGWRCLLWRHSMHGAGGIRNYRVIYNLL